MLRNNSQMLEWWLQPPVDPLTKVHIFNYTNIERYMSGVDHKIKVVDIGPFTYREKVEKTMMEYHNGTISFHVSGNYEHKTGFMAVLASHTRV